MLNAYKEWFIARFAAGQFTVENSEHNIFIANMRKDRFKPVPENILRLTVPEPVLWMETWLSLIIDALKY